METNKERIDKGEIECACTQKGKCGKHYFQKETLMDDMCNFCSLPFNGFMRCMCD